MLLLSLATFGGSFVLPHDAECHDHDCVPAFVEHDADAHRFQSNVAEAHAHPLHCLVCHWTRSFRPRPGTAFQPAPALDTYLRRPIEYFVVAPATLAAQPPLRSPPNA